LENFESKVKVSDLVQDKRIREVIVKGNIMGRRSVK
jgi:hypothetical protein